MTFYLQPLKDSIIALWKELRTMRKNTTTLCKYRMADNENMLSLSIKMVANDVTCQWLMGNDLKVDQLKFIYEVVKIIYNSPCREKLLAWDKEILSYTIPMLNVFKTFEHMRNWLNAKEEYEEKMKKLNLPPLPKEEAPVPPPVTTSPKKGAAKLPPPPTAEEIAEKEWLEKEKADHEMFGRYWIWENYFSENKRDLW